MASFNMDEALTDEWRPPTEVPTSSFHFALAMILSRPRIKHLGIKGVARIFLFLSFFLSLSLSGLRELRSIGVDNNSLKIIFPGDSSILRGEYSH